MTLSYAPFGDDEEEKSVVMAMVPQQMEKVPRKPLKPVTTNSITECNYILIIFIISMVFFTQTS